MGDVYYLLNHDRKEAFYLGKPLAFRNVFGKRNHETGRFIFSKLTADDIVAYLEENLPYFGEENSRRFAEDALAFDPQDLYEECSDEILDFYQKYIYSGSAYADSDPDLLGKPIHEDDDDDYKWEGDLHPENAPHLIYPHGE